MGAASVLAVIKYYLGESIKASAIGKVIANSASEADYIIAKAFIKESTLHKWGIEKAAGALKEMGKDDEAGRAEDLVKRSEQE